MDIEKIIEDKQALDEILKNALATMEKKDTIKEIHLKLMELQNECPHYSTKYNWAMKNDTCPYCGKKMG